MGSTGNLKRVNTFNVCFQPPLSNIQNANLTDLNKCH